jgi:hypothetical protein
MSLSMRLQCLCFLLAELVCDARNSLLPQITLGLSAGEGYGRGVGRLKGLEPILRWTAERDMGDSMLEVSSLSVLGYRAREIVVRGRRK